MRASSDRRRTPWPPWAHPAIVIVVITGWFHLYRGAPVDGVVFLGVGCWLAVTEARAPAPVVDELAVAGPRRSSVRTLVAVAGVLTLAPRYGSVDVMVVGLLGIAAVLLAATRGDVAPPVRRGPAWPYAVVGLVAALNELTAYLLETSPAADWRHPAFSDVMNPVFAWAPTRGLLVLVWLAGGLWLLHAMPARAPRMSETGDLQPWEPTS
ncbi:MAG: hypothetical protein WB797_13275 [Nocardioides sp.]